MMKISNGCCFSLARAASIHWALLSFVLVLLQSMSARADYTICVVGSVLTTDSGRQVPNGPNAGDTEDYWPNADSGVSKAIPGIQISTPDGTRSADGSGCADFPGTLANETVTIWSSTWRGTNNRLVLHDDPYNFDFTDLTPTWSYVYANQTTASGTTKTYTNVGSGIAKWTALFAANFMLDEYDNLLSGTRIYLGVDETCQPGPNPPQTNNVASAHYGPGGSASNSEITSGHHFLVVANCASTLLTRQKFIISHEMGHAIAALFYGDKTGASNGNEPNSTDYTNDTDPARGPTAAACQLTTPSGGPTYSPQTKEWNSVTFREGYAHFLTAVAWNVKNDPGAAGGSGTGQEGAFTFFGVSYDLERYNRGSGTNSGGRLENTCCVHNPPTTNCTTSWDSASVNNDWLLFLWDYWSEDGCSNNVTKANMLNIYAETRLNGGLTKGNYYTKTRAAMRELFTGSCLRAAWDNWADWNGVNHDT